MSVIAGVETVGTPEGEFGSMGIVAFPKRAREAKE
jgi:hypothetical protein